MEGVLLQQQGADAHTAHLLAQISFLHGEVERLETALTAGRGKSSQMASESAKYFEDIINSKNKELEDMRRRLKDRNEQELGKRCAMLEKQLAVSNSEKNVATIEKNEAKAQLRKIEADLKALKRKEPSVQSNGEIIKELKDKVSELIAEVETLTLENKKIRESKATPKPKSVSTVDASCNTSPVVADIQEVPASTVRAEQGTQTAATVYAGAPTDKECQVDTVFHTNDPEAQSMSNLTRALQAKTQECDSLRSALDDLKVVQEESLRVLELTKRQLAEEIEGRKFVSSDSEKMTIQVRALQQKVSQQAANERDLLAKIANLEEMRQRFHGSTVEIERERHNWEAVTRQHEKDIEQLVANKNYNNQQLSILANENENLRAEIQGLLLRESQAVFSLKAKDNEMHELLKAYQNAAKEHESIADNHRYLEREIDNLRAALSVKEEGIIYLQEQVATLHQREQQLILDLQSFEYDNDQLHRKVLQNEGALKQCEAKCAELNQIINAKQCIVEELHQNLSELSKQIVIKENETFLLRRRSESIENELSNLHAALTIERDRNSSLEDCNARLLTKEYLSTSHENGEEAKIEAIKTQCTEFREQLNLKESELQALREERKEMEEELKEERKRSSDALETKRRLEQIVYDQNEVLSHLAK